MRTCGCLRFAILTLSRHNAKTDGTLLTLSGKGWKECTMKEKHGVGDWDGKEEPISTLDNGNLSWLV
jgi:hypothetical protein